METNSPDNLTISRSRVVFRTKRAATSWVSKIDFEGFREGHIFKRKGLKFVALESSMERDQKKAG